MKKIEKTLASLLFFCYPADRRPYLSQVGLESDSTTSQQV